MTVLYILGGLFIALLVIIPLIEKSNVRMSDESMAKWSKWILPLVGIVLIAGMFKTFM